MKKRLLTMFTAMAMLIGTIATVNVSAATFIVSGWRDGSTLSNPASIARGTVCADAENVFSGGKSLHIESIRTEGDTTSTAWVESDVINGHNASKWIALEYYAKGNVGALRTNFYAGNLNIAQEANKVGTEVDGWQKYRAFACDTGGSGRLTLYPITNSSLDCYIDNIKLIEDETGDDYAANHNGVGGIGENITKTPLANSNIVADTSGEEYSADLWKLRTNEGELGDGSAYDLRYSTLKAHTGGGSFHLQYDEEDVRGTKYMELRSARTTTADGNITVEFYANGVTNAENVITAIPGVGEVALSAYTADTTDSEWTKYTYTGTAATTAGAYRVNNFRIRLTEDSDIYIDDLTVTDSTNADILGGTGTFEPSYIPSITPDETGADCSSDWNVRTGDGGLASSVYEVKYSTKNFYEGNRSLHIQYDEMDSSDAKYMEIRTMKNTTQYGDFTISFYAYTENPDDIANIGILFPKYAEVNLTDYDVTPTDKEGWNFYTYTDTIASGSRPDTLRFRINAKTDVYIDEMTIIQPDGTDMLGETGHFDIKAPTIKIDPTMKSVTLALKDMGNGQKLVKRENSGMVARVNEGKAAYDAGISSLETYAGNGSFHFQLAMADAPKDGDSITIRFENVRYPVTDMNGRFFKVSFYAKGNVDGVGLQFFDGYYTCWMKNWEYKGGTITQIPGSDWKLYEMIIPRTDKGSNDIVAFSFWENTDSYIDELVITEVTDATGATPVENSAYNMAYNFETEESILKAKGFTPVFSDKDGKVLNALTTAQSKKNITAKAAVANWSDSEYASTAQLVIAVYDGYTLVDIKRSDITNVTMGNSAATLSCDIKLPEYTEESNLRVAAYLWNSAEGMIPLAEQAVITAE